ncbi:GNAT family N-acetyltransferase [Haloarcula onubensis]|uniref:GNAT family N-acetyltransferase n=1 Tax=Haloarcula onubensis TaxID=2950539 RepID=A0ABU2FNM1_9EURY|nr:GNAT family N-acetyltransferase [Halomicroarcula sp. S3CR25-11]MDS0281766.1 GNAT family N-acetyltransferase [Halomicroarcula sp. S3CR25-11]
MALDIAELADNEASTWNDALDRTRERTPFHRFEALQVFADHADADLHPLLAYKGEQPVGLFPIFTVRKGPITAAFSPPPELKVSYLGPVVLAQPGMKPHSKEKRRRRLIEGSLDWLDEQYDPEYVHVRTSLGAPDVRPFDWATFTETPRFTYVVDLDAEPETLRDRFSRDARSNVRDATEACEVSEEGITVARRVIRQVQDRHAEQDLDFPLTTRFVEDLYRALPEGYLRPYACTVDGEFVGGSLILDDGERVYNWQGTAKQETDHDVNDLLHWEVLRAAAERGHSAYDLVGANDQRLSRYKSKFAPTLRTYHSLERSSAGLGTAARLYRQFA